MNHKLIDDWLKQHKLKLDEEFTEALHRYAVIYKKNKAYQSQMLTISSAAIKQMYHYGGAILKVHISLYKRKN